MDDIRHCFNDGVDLKYKIWKSPTSSKKLVLVHPLAMNLHFWTDFVPHLKHYFEIIAFDCRGHGNSSKPKGPYSAELFAKDLSAVMDDAGWTKAIIAGASMGGCVALAFAGLYAKKVDGLGLIDTTAYYGENAPEIWEERAQKALVGGMGALIDFQKLRWVTEDFIAKNSATIRRVVDIFLENDPAIYAETCRMLGAVDLRSHLHQFDFPVIIIVGEEDYATPPSMAAYLNENIRSSEIQIIQQARHFTPLECPELVASHLCKYF